MPAWILALLQMAFKSVLEVFSSELFKFLSAPDTVLEDVKPVLDHVDPITDDSAFNDGLLARYGGLRL